MRYYVIDEVTRIFRELKSENKNIELITLIDHDGYYRFPTNPRFSGNKLNEQVFGTDFLELTELTLEKNTGGYTIRAPIELDNSVPYYLYVEFNDSVIENLIRRIVFFEIILMILTFTIGVIILNVLLNVTIKHPITLLTHSADIISDGDLSHRVNINTNDEIGHLAQKFNLMAHKLNISIALSASILESMPAYLVSIGNDGEILQWNQAAEKFFKFSGENIKGKKFWDIHPLLASCKEIFFEVIGTQAVKEFNKEDISLNEITYYNIQLFPLIEKVVEGAVIKITDTTETEKKEAQLQQAQKMDMIGTLAGGIAHDFNNILGGITGTLSLLKYSMKNSESGIIGREELEDPLSVMEDLLKRASDLSNQLLTLSRKHELNINNYSLKFILENVIKICSNTFDKSIIIKTSFSDENQPVLVDMTQMEQVFLNLMVNANHAMTIMRSPSEKQGGVISVSSELLKTDYQFCLAHPEANIGMYLKVTISDTGVGMDTKTLAKIFNPFFTTKEKGKGTGLGLSMVYNIVQQHNGFIDVYSEPGRGTTFNVYLPGSCMEGPCTIKDSTEEIPKGEGLILVVDDEKPMRVVAEKMLRECGYDVITANNGAECVSLFRKRNKEIKAVLLDMVMPFKSGKEAFIEMKEIKDDVCVVLTSGFRNDDNVASTINLGIKAFIQKPYTIEQLSATIYNVLNPENLLES